MTMLKTAQKLPKIYCFTNTVIKSFSHLFVGVILVNENPLKYFMNENAIENFACVCVYTYLSANDYMRSVGKQTGKKVAACKQFYAN
jgi:hypothetical protein